MRVANALKRPDDLSNERVADMFSLIMHFHGSAEPKEREYEALDGILKRNNISVAAVMASVAPDCSDLLRKCSWKNFIVLCETLFRVIKTSEGVCCSFNYHGTDLDYTEK